MTSFVSSKSKLFFFWLIFTIISATTYAFASSNTGSPSNAGEGSKAINGYVVSNVAYGQGSDPSKIGSTSLTLDAPATKVQIKLSDAQVDWYDCTNANGYNWICNTNNHPISSADKLQVVASN
jgi:hypothetical protein